MNPARRQFFAELVASGDHNEVLKQLADPAQVGSDTQSMCSFFCGVALQHLGRLDEAAESYQEAADSLIADLLQTWNNLAGANYHRGKFIEAADVASQLRPYSPLDAEQLSLHVLALKEGGDPSGAEKEARQFVESLPRSVSGARWLAHILWANKRPLEAMYTLSDIPVAQWVGMGLTYEFLLCLIDLGLRNVAKEMFLSFFGSQPEYFASEEVCTLTGYLAFIQGDLVLAQSVLEGGYARGFQNTSIAMNLGFVHLTQGNFEKGWQHYIARHQVKTKGHTREVYDIPHWQGEPLCGKTLLIVSEQGLGDVIQFLRFVPQMESFGARVVFAAYSDIVGLMANDPLAKKNTVPPISSLDIHYQAQLLDLPYRLGINKPSDIPQRIPYLFANAEKVEQWREALKDEGDFRVGLVWAGNPNHEEDHCRSASINIFLPFSGMPGVKFFGLQKGEGIKEAKLPPEGLDFEWLGDRFANFDDTAAAIANLDLVISVDTSVAHLAAALGKPVWLLASLRNPDWRWTDHGQGNAWYPNLTVFRQEIADDWLGLIKKHLRPRLAERILESIEISDTLRQLLAIDANPELVKDVDWSDWAGNLEPVAALDQAVNWGRRWLREGGSSVPVEAICERFKGNGGNSSSYSNVSSLWAYFLFQNGDTEAAINLWRAILAAEGEEGIGRWAYVLWGFNSYKTGNFIEAIEILEAGCLVFPLDAHLFYFAAMAYRDSGNKSKAIELLRQAIQLSPRHYAAHTALGAELLKTDISQALLHLQKAVMFNINYSDGWCEIVKVLNDRGLYWLAEKILQDRCDIHKDFGISMLFVQTLIFQGRITEAFDFLQTVVVDRKASVSNLRMYAWNLFELGYHEKSFEFLINLIEQYPHDRGAKMLLGHSLLRTGNCATGWRYYWEGLPASRPEFPEWKGESLSGKSLLIMQDQGQGDAIQFIPLLRELAQLGPRRMVFAVTAKALIKLIQFQNVPCEVVDSEKMDWDDYRYDYQVKIMALPYLLKVDLLNSQCHQPTLQAPKNIVPKWSEFIEADVGLKVGIAWAGGSALGHDYLRSSPLTEWSELWQLAGISLYSLQKDMPSNQAAVFQYPLNNIAADCPNWLHTLSAIQSLDLVITVDTAIAHAAASLNIPTWILLSDRHTDYRWMQQREDCPWYPSVRLFRKKTNEPWQAVLSRVSDALIETYPQLSLSRH